MPDTAAPIPKLAWMLDGVPPARLFDEVNKMFLAGSARARSSCCERLRSARASVPGSRRARSQEAPDGRSARELVRLGLQGTDERVRADKSVTPTFLFAVLLWPAIQRAFAKLAHGEGRRSAASARRLRPASRRVSRRASRSRSASRCRCASWSACSRASSGARAGGRCACSIIRAFAPPTISCCCAPRPAKSIAELAKWWTDIQAASADERDRARRAASAPSRGSGVRRPAPPSSSAPPQTARARRERSGCGCRRTSRSAAISTIRRAQIAARVRRARALLDGCRLVARSRLYRSAPLGPQDQPDFVNAVAGLLTVLAPRELLRALKRIEARARTRAARRALGAAAHRSRPAAARRRAHRGAGPDDSASRPDSSAISSCILCATSRPSCSSPERDGSACWRRARGPPASRSLNESP